jgi:hypothetical protein
MWDFRLGEAIGLMFRTLPFIVLRIVIYFGITLAFILVTGIGAGLGWGIGAFGTEDFQGSSAVWGGIIGFGLTGGVLFFLRAYILYMVKAAHLAVIVELLNGASTPDGKTQITYGQQVVRERFGEVNVLFAIDQIVKGVLHAVTGLVRGVLSVLPIPGLQQIIGLVQAFLNIAVGFVDEVILSYGIRTRAQNPWESARTALILYGQNYKEMLKNAAWLVVVTYVLAFVIFLFALAPAGALVVLLPGPVSAFSIVIALLFAWSIKAAILEPLAITCMLQVYFDKTAGQAPDPEWEKRLDGLSGKFRKLAEKGAAWVGRRQTGPSVA